ncbi:uncharacterized protein V6R79_024436 [Siganus canaliculatus]
MSTHLFFILNLFPSCYFFSFQVLPQPLPRSLSPTAKPDPVKPIPQMPSHPLPLSVPSNAAVVEPPSDFSSLAQFTPCLDTSAARHRMSIKPRNQRASSKKRLAPTDSETVNHIDYPVAVREEELGIQEEETLETLHSKSPELAPIVPEVTSTPSSLTPSHQDQHASRSGPSLPPQILRAKPHRPADERPHSSFIPSEVKEISETPSVSQDKRNLPNKTGVSDVASEQRSATFGSMVAQRPSSAQQQVPGGTESTKGIKRPTPGSGSFHFTITTAKNRDGERPRSGSFIGVLDQTEARQRAEDKPFSSMKEKAELRDSLLRGGPYAVGKLRQEGAPNKSSVLSWERRESLKKMEPATPAKHVTTDAGAGKLEEVEKSQEVVEEAVEAREVEDEEEEGKKAFGIKLRSTSHSMKIRSDISSNHNSKPLMSQEQRDRQEGLCKKLPTNISSSPTSSGELRLTDPAPSGSSSLPVKPSTCDPHNRPAELQTTTTHPKEAEPDLAAPPEPQPAPSEVSWMSLAMEKTRSLQQLFTSRFPRDITGTQAASRPQAQVQMTKQSETATVAQTQMQTVKIQSSTASMEAVNHPSPDAAKTETVQSGSHAQTVKPSPVAAQQRTPVQSNALREQQTSKQTNEPQSHPNSAQSALQPASAHTSLRTTHSPLHSTAQTESSSRFTAGGVTQSLAQSYLASTQQQPTWSNKSLHHTSQVKSTTPVAQVSVSSTAAAAAAPHPAGSAMGRGEKETPTQEKEAASLPVWAGSVMERAAFLERTAAPGTKGVEMKKSQPDSQTFDESPASTKPVPVNKDPKPEARPGLTVEESSPTKLQDKWLRKNVPPSSLPSSSPTATPALQSVSNSGQPSWMELAKRKSMAWSDKTLD